jgi:hypothetical protein
MIKKLWHLLLAITFPAYVFIVLILKVLFTNNGLGDEWTPEANQMLENVKFKQ